MILTTSAWRAAGQALRRSPFSVARETVQSAYSPSLFWTAGLEFDESQDDLAVALAGPAHGPHAVDRSRLDLDEAIGPDRAAWATVLRPWAASRRCRHRPHQ